MCKSKKSIAEVIDENKDDIESLYHALGKWSYSKSSTLFTCPKKFYLRYILKEKPTSQLNSKTNLGLVVHKLLETILLNPDTNLTEIRDRYHLTDEEFNGFVKNANQVLTRISEYENNKEPILDIGIEKRITNKEFNYLGLVDLYLETPTKILTLDHKTTSSKPTLYWYKDQLYFYGGLLSLEKDNSKPVLHGINFAVHDTILWDTELKTQGYLKSNLIKTKRKIKSKLKEHINSGEWPAEINNLCPYCDYRDTCEEYQQSIK